MPHIDIDPKLVREVAEAAFRSTAGGTRAKRVEAGLIASGMAGPVMSEKFDTFTGAVGAEYDRLVASTLPIEQAAAHLIENLQKMADDAMRVAESQNAAAEGTSNYTRQLKHEDSAKFHRALASEIDKVLYKLRARAAGDYPGVPGDGWADKEGDIWVLCADGRMRLLDDETTPREPHDLAGEYGPMEPVRNDD